MHEKITQVKTHLAENKTVYFAGAASLATGIAAGVLVASHPGIQASVVQKTYPILSWRPISNQMVIQLVEESTPSKPVHLVGTDLYFKSISDAARKTGHSISAISQVVNGHRANAGGDVFELLQPA